MVVAVTVAVAVAVGLVVVVVVVMVVVLVGSIVAIKDTTMMVSLRALSYSRSSLNRACCVTNSIYSLTIN